MRLEKVKKELAQWDYYFERGSDIIGFYGNKVAGCDMTKTRLKAVRIWRKSVLITLVSAKYIKDFEKYANTADCALIVSTPQDIARTLSELDTKGDFSNWWQHTGRRLAKETAEQYKQDTSVGAFDSLERIKEVLNFYAVECDIKAFKDLYSLAESFTDRYSGEFKRVTSDGAGLIGWGLVYRARDSDIAQKFTADYLGAVSFRGWQIMQILGGVYFYKDMPEHQGDKSATAYALEHLVYIFRCYS